MSKRRPLRTSSSRIYCGRADPDTVDHIPPKNLFAKPRPSSLVTVPSCTGCNRGASQDDEYFRLMVTLRHDLDHVDASAAMEAAMRSLERPQGRGLLAALLATTRRVEVKTPAGLYLGHAGTYQPDFERLYRVVRRIIRGLFYRETGRRLPDGYQVNVFTGLELPPEKLAHIADIVREVVANSSLQFIV